MKRSLPIQKTKPEKSKVVFDEEAYSAYADRAIRQYQKVIFELTSAREKLGFTQADLAMMLDWTQPRISEIENLRSTEVSLIRILLLGQALGKTLELRVVSTSEKAGADGIGNTDATPLFRAEDIVTDEESEGVMSELLVESGLAIDTLESTGSAIKMPGRSPDAEALVAALGHRPKTRDRKKKE